MKGGKNTHTKTTLCGEDQFVYNSNNIFGMRIIPVSNAFSTLLGTFSFNGDVQNRFLIIVYNGQSCYTEVT